MIRNNEFREILLNRLSNLENIPDNGKGTEFENTITVLLKYHSVLLKEYDRLHPDLSGVKEVHVRDKQPMPDASHVGGYLHVFDNVANCNITLIDNALNIEIK